MMIKKRTGHHRGGPSPSFLGKGALKLGTVGDFREHAVVLRIRRPRTLPFFACISSKWLASVWIKLRVPSRRRPGGPLHPLVPWGPSAAAARVLSMDSPEQKATNDTLTRQWSKWSVCKSKYLHTWLSSSVPRHFCDRRLFFPLPSFLLFLFAFRPSEQSLHWFFPFLVVSLHPVVGFLPVDASATTPPPQHVRRPAWRMAFVHLRWNENMDSARRAAQVDAVKVHNFSSSFRS